MVQITGAVHVVSGDPDKVEKLLVRAVAPRMDGIVYISEEPASFPVVAGVMDFEALPGPCVVTFVRNHGVTTHEKLLVPDAETATFLECIKAASLADEGTASALEEVVHQIQRELGKAAPLVDEVRGLREDVEHVRNEVADRVQAAQDAEAGARTAEQGAASHKAGAMEQARVASGFADAASVSVGLAEQAKAGAEQAKTGAEEAKAGAASHESAALAAANTAKGHETDAKNHADRAESAKELAGEYAQQLDPENVQAAITSRLEEIIDGAPGDLDTLREIADYAQANRDITDQLSAAIAGKANKSHSHPVSEVTGLAEVLGGKAEAEHTHTVEEVEGLDAALAGKAVSEHTHTSSEISDTTSNLYLNNPEAGNKLVKTNSYGNITFEPPQSAEDPTNKEYVDGQIAETKDIVYSRPATFNVPSINGPLPAAARAGDVVIETDTWSFYVLVDKET